MSKYIHLFKNESTFNADYYGDNYLEPWVSLTKKKIGNVKSFIINPEGTDLTLYYQYQDDIDYFEWTDTYEEFEITSIDTSNNTITIGNIVANYSSDTLDGKCTWIYHDESTNYNNYYLTNSSTPQVGDIAVLYDKKDSIWIETTSRNPKVSDIVEYWPPVSEGSIDTPILSIENEDGGDLNRVNYNKNKNIPLKEVPLTFEIQNDGNIYWSCDDNLATEDRVTIEYSKNGGEWISITSATGDTAPSISVVSGDTIQFRGDNPTYCIGYSSQSKGCFQPSNAIFKIKGNIMSLINSTDFANLTTLESESTFYYLFTNCTGLTDASNLILPATTLTPNCYRNMFYNCTSLTGVPALPATALAYCCYLDMFNGCTSLVNAPELPATTLADSCYGSMFANCTSLTTAPELPATTLTWGCYQSMFANCTSLTTAPELPATTLASVCYRYMFEGCSNLNYIKCLTTDISTTNNTTDWVSGVASTGTFVKAASMSSWTTGSNGIPSGWTVQNA